MDDSILNLLAYFNQPTHLDAYRMMTQMMVYSGVRYPFWKCMIHCQYSVANVYAFLLHITKQSSELHCIFICPQ